MQHTSDEENKKRFEKNFCKTPKGSGKSINGISSAGKTTLIKF